MPSPIAKAGYFERQITVTSLGSLVAALARTLGQAAIGGPDLERLLVETIEVECVSCGIIIPGADLIAASLGPDAAPTGSSPKLARLRLGYCARNNCDSSYYLVRLAPRPNIDWGQVWIQVEPSLTGAPPPRIATPSRVRWKGLVPPEWVRRVARPAPICLVSVLAVVLLLRSGCRVPGVSPKPRVFIVSGADPGSAAHPLVPR